MEEKRALLKRYFGHAAFRGGQEALIDAILSGRDVLGVMPTGGGKSVCYQLPALLLPGLTVVVSPLISLMKDQVAALTEAGIPAVFLNSSLSFEQLRSTYAKASAGQYKLLYVAPERLETESFLSLTARVPVSLLAVDEAHCISQWGAGFPPKLSENRGVLVRAAAQTRHRRLHGDRHRAGPRRYHRAPGACEPALQHHGLRPPEPLF